ncbi:MAG: MFS transporter [Opitutales bacterium]|nr:MFS transporter [Opitutales bacterium]
MFDFANQAYTLLILTVVFGDLFTRVIVADGPDYRLGNLLWSVSLAISYLLVVLSGPFFGAVMDYTRTKKCFLFASYLLTVVCTALLYFVAPGYALLGMLLIILSNFGYSSGMSFISSFLPDLGPKRDLGWISGLGWALGYVGGMCSAVFVLMVLGDVTAENFDRIRWVGPWAAFFFLVAALPTFIFLKERGRRQKPPQGISYPALGFSRVRQTLMDARRYHNLWWLFVSVFFAMSGTSLVITFSFIYGSQVVGWDESVRVLMFVIVQITAAIGALSFGFLQHRIGPQRTYQITLGLWIAAIVLIFATPELEGWLHSIFGLEWQAQHIFLVVGCVAGISLGSCQSAIRTLVGVLAPSGRTAEFFGFWGLSVQLASAFSLLALGLLQALVGLQLAVLLCAVFFSLALVLSGKFSDSPGNTAGGESQ